MVWGWWFDFVAQVILVRSMGLGDFGLYALAISVIMMVSAFGGLGLLASLPRYLAIHHRDGHRWAIRQVLKRSLVALMIPAVLATGIGAILFLNSSPAAVDTGPEMPSASRAIGLGLLFAPFMFLYTWGVTSLSGLGRFRAFFWINRVLMGMPLRGGHARCMVPHSISLGRHRRICHSICHRRDPSGFLHHEGLESRSQA